MKRVAIVLNPDNPLAEPILRAMVAAATSLRVNLYRLPVRGPNAFSDALSSLIAENVEALVLVDDGMLIANAQEFGGMSSAQRLTSIGFTEFARGGGLLGYGVNFPAMFSRAAILVDRILKGAKPGDLPIEQATKFEMVVNLRTAKALGLDDPAHAPRPRRRGDRVRRREVIAGLSAVGGAAAWPLRVSAQTERTRRIAVLMSWAAGDPESLVRLAAFRDGLQKLGWREGHNLRLDIRWATSDTGLTRLSRKNWSPCSRT